MYMHMYMYLHTRDMISSIPLLALRDDETLLSCSDLLSPSLPSEPLPPPLAPPTVAASGREGLPDSGLLLTKEKNYFDVSLKDVTINFIQCTL